MRIPYAVVMRRLALLLMTAATLSLTTPAQQEQPSQTTQDKQQDTVATNAPATDAAVTESAPADTPNPGYPIDTKVHPALRAVPWMGTDSPLRWGSFYIGDFTIDQVRDDFQPTGISEDDVINLSVFRTSLVFDKMFARQRIVLRYEPQLAVLNGNLAGNAGMDNDVLFGTTFQLTPRLNLKLENDFAQVNSRELYPPNFLAVDQQTGGMLQNAFLANNGKFLMDAVSAVISYELSPRDNLTVSPVYRYVKDTANNVNAPVFIAAGHTIANDIAYTHALTQRQNLGVVYGIQILRATNVPGVSGTADTYFHTLDLFYANQLSRDWWLRGELGTEYVNYEKFAPNTTTIAGGFTLMRNFTHSMLAFSYNRGKTTENYITGRIGDRTDIFYGIHLNQRLMWSNGGGYYREMGASPRTRGEYGTTGLGYTFLKDVELHASYTYMSATSDTQQVLSGTRNTILCGLKWEPHPLVGH